MKTKNASISNNGSKVHPWRLCPSGAHWVRSHPMQVPPSKTFPEGHETTRRGHCAHNPSGKDQLYPDEIHEIANRHFAEVKNRPCNIDAEFGQIANKYDDLISGWVSYWNDILKPSTPLTPNMVKALIATESRFIPDALANK